MSAIDDTLRRRGDIYGASFLEQAGIAQRLKDIVRQSPNYKTMRVDMRESMDLIVTKMSRILYGEPNHIDSWHDIAGYARLVEKALLQTEDTDGDGKTPTIHT